jgi:tripartite-type tricarboxylate transporter receptor subunit TctC
MTERADLYFAPVFSIRKFVEAGTILPLAVGSPARTPIYPDLPTTVEAGYPNSDYNFWIGALVAARTPPEIVQRLNRAFNEALADAEVQKRMAQLGIDPYRLTPEEFGALIRRELEENAQLVKKAGLKVN